MKKLLALVLVLGMTSLASAGISLYIPEDAPGGSRATELQESESARIYIVSDIQTGLLGLNVLVTLDGNGEFTGAVGKADAGAWGQEVLDFMGTPFPLAGTGWDSDYTNDPILAPDAVEIALGNFSNDIFPTSLPVLEYQPANGEHLLNGVFDCPWYYAPLGYIDIHCGGAGDLTVTMTPVTTSGGSYYIDGSPISADLIDGEVTIYQVIPEPLTMSLLGLGGLALIRRRRA
jgi:hypothetical protein